jgi:hypothetical protein
VPEALAIPEAIQAGFRELAQLEDASFNSLLGGLQASNPSLLPASLARRLAREVNLEPAALERILVSTLSTLSLSDHLSQPIRSLIHSIATSKDLNLDENRAQVLSARLDRLIATESIVITAKALQVLTSHERPLHSARILTDLRPVFLSDPSVRPTAAGILHTLALSIHRGDGGLDRVYVAMDEEDLQHLKDAVARAETKARTLAAFCEESAVKVIDPREAT